jgi:membrane associated rhomboid family serine protease
VHTLTVTLSGLVLLFVFLFIANSINKRKNKRVVDGSHIFIWFWLLVSIINFYVGVFVANYSFATEVGVHLIIFGVPAAVAWYLSRRSVAKR